MRQNHALVVHSDKHSQKEPDMIKRQNHFDNPPRRPACRVNISRLAALGPVLALALGLSSCTPAKPVAEVDYGAKIVGNWLGTVGDMKESITFSADGSFIAQLRPQGFISNTLSQGVTGTIRGTWAINGKDITLKITSAEDERVKQSVISATIMAFAQDELSMKSDRGETSKFVRTIAL
jgi:hypothetical protein